MIYFDRVEVVNVLAPSAGRLSVQLLGIKMPRPFVSSNEDISRC